MAYNMNANDDFMDRKAMANKPANTFYDPGTFYSPNAPQPGMVAGGGGNMAPPGAAQPGQFYSDWPSPMQYYNPSGVAAGGDPYGGGFMNASGHIGQKSVPVADFAAASGISAAPVDEFENEPPLLEELGINFKHIYRKTVCVLNPFAKPHESIVDDEDLAGPLVFCIAYGFSLLLMGKIQFGYVYGITALGCLSMYVLLNLMSEKGVTVICIGSTLGYCLLPMVFLSFLASFVTLNGYVGLCISVLFILWCSISSSKLFVYALNMSNQQLLVLYPCFLLYGIFALLNVF